MECERGQSKRNIYFINIYLLYGSCFQQTTFKNEAKTEHHMQKADDTPSNRPTICRASILLAAPVFNIWKSCCVIIIRSDESRVNKTALDWMNMFNNYRSEQSNAGGQRNVINFSPLRRSRLPLFMNVGTHTPMVHAYSREINHSTVSREWDANS